MSSVERPDLRRFRSDSRTIVRELGFLRESWTPVDLPHTQVHLLLELAEGSYRPSELAERLLTDPAVISRSVRALTDRGWLTAVDDPDDRRQKHLVLTSDGRAAVERIHDAADTQVAAALSLMSPEQRARVADGFRVYARALVSARRQQDFVVRPIQPTDDPQVTGIICQVMPEFGASGPGFAIHDPEVAAMSTAYPGGRARYLVVDHGGRLVGGGGFAPLIGADPDVCELRKMYFLPEVRGLGLGAGMLGRLLDEAATAGFRGCYLETLTGMSRARALYEGFGFERLNAPMGSTGHFGCDMWYFRAL
jgi:putative acetyltransferase